MNDAEPPVNDLVSTVPLMTLSLLDWIALIILIAGGLNWGLVGVLNMDLIGAALGQGSIGLRLAHMLIGLAALYGIAFAWRLGGRRR